MTPKRLKPDPLYHRIISLLERRPELRDDDPRLIAVIWWYDLKDQGVNPDTNGTAILHRFAAGKMVKPDSITRLRRKAQEEFPNLRAESYDERQEMQRDVVDDLANLRNPENATGGGSGA